MDRLEIVHENFLRRVAAQDLPMRRSSFGLVEAELREENLFTLFRAQVISRHLDRAGRRMQACGQGYYTISSSGHEGVAAVAAALRSDDPAFLHYRDAAFQIQRALQSPDQDPIRDILLSFATACDDPISGGRHKVLGSKSLNIPPQTSTIASHLPKAVGAAYSIALARRLHPEHQAYRDDGIVLCSFGDASLNHSTAQGALNTASWAAYQSMPMPILFLCADNGIGISTKTPKGWIAASVRNRPELAYFCCDGRDLLDTFATTQQAVRRVRGRRKPAFLHLQTTRIGGHAGSDAPLAYLSENEIAADEDNDPLLMSARLLIENRIASHHEILRLYQALDAQITEASEKAMQQPKLRTADEVMASLIPPSRACTRRNAPSQAMRKTHFSTSEMRAQSEPQHLAKLLNLALNDLMLSHSEIVLAGEDVAAKGGVYGITRRLHERFGGHRVINTLLDEQSILGLGLGLAHNGILPIVEIQFLAYLHNAEDQLRGEAATLSFFSNGQFSNPCVIRIAGLGYQRGFGGHFHNDNALGVLRDIPGLIVACPSGGGNAVHLLRECVRLAREEQRVVVFLEPIARYMTRDLHETGDGLWCALYPEPDSPPPIRFGTIGTSGTGGDLSIISYGNGYYLASQAEKILHEKHNIAARLIDLCWLSPLPEAALIAALGHEKKILIVDECRRSGGIGEGLVTLLHERLGANVQMQRLAAEDSFIATGPAYAATLPSRNGIVAAARNLYES